MGRPITSNPENPDALLTRVQTAKALTEAGFPTAPATLATKASRGGGPPYQLFGQRVLYQWSTALAWARSRLSEPRCSSAEGDSYPGEYGENPNRRPDAPLDSTRPKSSSRKVRAG
jgi:hypothetical protein